MRQTLVHTGQHYDVNMSDVFFEQLGIPKPDINLEVGSNSHGRQTADIMIRFEAVIQESNPDVVLVYGDVNSTMAAALVCAKLGIRVGHVEAGLRSFDRNMPEEINRVVTDQLSDMLFTHSEDADENLLKEGVSSKKIFRVGNVMIDSLIELLPAATLSQKNGLPHRYALVTLHRPSNVDDDATLREIMNSLLEVNAKIPVVFPVHPRTRCRIEQFGIDARKLHLLEPKAYIDFLALEHRATLVITDSGGIQEETSYLQIPCLTMRENTERPVTVTLGTNSLVGHNRSKLLQDVEKILAGNWQTGVIPPLWDGNAGQRIAEVLQKIN